MNNQMTALVALTLGCFASTTHGQCGTFAEHVTYGVGDYPFSVAVGDLDGDLDLDLAVANYDSYTVSVLMNECPECSADFDGDTDTADLLALLGAWGSARRN